MYPDESWRPLDEAEESISSFVTRWRAKVAGMVDRPKERSIDMVLGTSVPRFARRVLWASPDPGEVGAISYRTGGPRITRLIGLLHRAHFSLPQDVISGLCSEPYTICTEAARQFTPLGMTLTRAFEKLRDAGVIVPLAPRPLPHPIPPHFRLHEHCLYHRFEARSIISSFHSSSCFILLSPAFASVRVFTRFQRSRHDYVGWMPVFSIGHVRSREHDVRGFGQRMGGHHFMSLFTLSPSHIELPVRTHDVFYALHIMHEGSCGMTLHWGIAISEGVFIGDTVALLDTLHWDTLYSSMVGHSRDGEHFSLEHSHPIWILYTGACPSFGGRSDWFLTLEHLTSDREIIGLFHVVLIAYWGIATLLEVLTLRLDFLFVIAAYDGLWSYRHLGFSLLGILG
ncbi:hypothetical protein AAG906_038766 [Vitis piasezkii]